MRIRLKKWARPELAACPFVVQNPELHRNNWKSVYRNSDAPLYLEIGCGKGGFTAQSAILNPEINYLAIDIKPDMLGVAKRKTEQLFRENDRTVNNLRLCVYNIENIEKVLGEDDRIGRLYINFCNPWPKSKHKKHRLTYTRFLLKYRHFLDGEIRFKTDDDGLFEESLAYFEDAGYTVTYITRDLHNSGFSDNVMTEHEQMFIEDGKTIKFLIAVPDKEPKVDEADFGSRPEQEEV